MTSLLGNAPSIRRHSIGLDAIRGVLALSVVFTHLIPWTQVAQGAEAMPGPLVAGRAFATRLFQPSAELGPGVLAFIVLSGYCIHRAGFRASGGSIARYAVRRTFRILPVFIVATMIGIAGFLTALRLDPIVGTQLSGTIAIDPACVAAKLAGVAALVPVFHPCSYAGNAPLTTVMVEFWLYVAYAVLFWLFIRRGHERAVWWICGALFVAGLVVAAGASRAPILYNWWQNSSVAGFLAFWWIGALFVSPAVASRSRPLALTALGVWLALTALPVHPVAGELKKLMFCVVA
ncbi:MAG: acyltransferase, partial [Thermomicrobiales bacterium]|nr:acyltransferase [Thermomicrobiales bacterium]